MVSLIYDLHSYIHSLDVLTIVLMGFGYTSIDIWIYYFTLPVLEVKGRHWCKEPFYCMKSEKKIL